MVENPGCSFPALLALLLALMFFVPVGVDEAVSPETPEPVVVSVPLTAENIDEAEALWNAQGIDNYTIAVMDGSIWHLQTNTVSVREGEIVESFATCSPAPAEGGECVTEAFDPAAFTVPGLFEAVRSVFESEQAEWAQWEFDGTYGYPRELSFNVPEIIDEEWFWRVTSFEALAK